MVRLDSKGYLVIIVYICSVCEFEYEYLCIDTEDFCSNSVGLCHICGESTSLTRLSSWKWIEIVLFFTQWFSRTGNKCF